VQSVGIMSMQRILNYGSSLQAYALRRLIEEADPNASVSYLDYRPGPILLKGEKSSDRRRSGLARAASKLREYSSVDARFVDKVAFFNHKRRYGNVYLPLIGVGAELAHQTDVDIQVIGSDEVFNCVQSNENVGYSRDLFGHGSRAGRVVSYAASFGNTTLAKIDTVGIRPEIASDLSRFSAISVRDENSRRLVEQLTSTSPPIHLDPTLVYDFTPSVPAARPDAPDKYIVAYGYSGRFQPSENAEIAQYARRIGARVIALGGLQSSADQYVDCDPFTLLAYFRDAAAVVTDTFHGTIFSVLSEVPFATIVRPSIGNEYGNEEKLGYLLRVLGLEGRRVNPGDRIGDILDAPIDYPSVKDLRAQEKARTLRYLSDVLTT